MEYSGFDAKAIRAVVIDGACLWGATPRRSLIEKLARDRQVLVLNRVDLRQPSTNSTPLAALFMICQQYGFSARECLYVDHDHRRAHTLGRFGFQAAVVLQSGGHTRKLLKAGLMSSQDLRALHLIPLTGLSQLGFLLQHSPKIA